jgi:hypothetical protein
MIEQAKSSIVIVNNKQSLPSLHCQLMSKRDCFIAGHIGLKLLRSFH